MGTTIYLMRHGETLFNTQKRVQGWSDSPLTARGMEQAIAVRNYFASQDIVFQSAYSSTQERATDTLKLVTEAPYYQLKGLKEMNFGVFEAREEVLLPKLRPDTRSFEDLLVPYGGEDIRDVGERVKALLLHIGKHATSSPVLVVSRGAAIWGLLQVLGVHFPEDVYLPNCAIFKVQYEDGRIEVKTFIDPTNQFKKKSFEWYKQVIASNGLDLD